MKLRAVEQLRENLRYLRLDDARAVVLDDDAEARRLVGRRRRRNLHDLDVKLRQDAGLLASIERVVDRFLHGRQERLRGVVEPQQVAVLREELAHRNLAL